MQDRNYTKKLDGIALTVTLFLLLSIVYNGIFKDVIKNMVASALTLAALITLYNAVTKPSRHREIVRKTDSERSRLIYTNLKVTSDSRLRDFFEGLFSRAGYDCTQSEGILFASKDGVNHIVLWDFDSESAGTNDVYRCERTRTEKGAEAFILMCNAASHCARTALRQLDCAESKIFCRTTLFKAMKKYDFFLECPYNFVIKRQGIAEILQYAFSRARFKSYFLLALIMYLFSFITIFKTYYLLFAAVLFALAAYSIANKRFNGRPQSFMDEL